MPRQKPGKSETIVRTPPEFLAAAKAYLGVKQFDLDLAACADNAVSSCYFTIEQDALSLDWFDWMRNGVFKLFHNKTERTRKAWCWLNPPYDDIGKWAEKCLLESMKGLRVAFLVPASVGSNWWRDFVHEQAQVEFLNGRILFLDKFGEPICSPKTGKPTPYPKDLALILYGNEPGYDVWDWRKQAA